ncbi:hypothetical protein, partial [Escherichia coli]|uniref:hypothetical protein n=1 Tax=Escherichia coli TaxID=562 RepID=UPI001F49D93A
GKNLINILRYYRNLLINNPVFLFIQMLDFDETGLREIKRFIFLPLVLIIISSNFQAQIPL